MIPHEHAEDVGSIPVSLKSYSQDKLAVLKAECLEIVALVLGSRTFQTSVGRSFAIGDVSILTSDYFSPIVEKLLLLTPKKQSGASRIFVT